MPSNCSGPCFICACNGFCLAGNGDDDFSPTSLEKMKAMKQEFELELQNTDNDFEKSLISRNIKKIDMKIEELTEENSECVVERILIPGSDEKMLLMFKEKEGSFFIKHNDNIILKLSKDNGLTNFTVAMNSLNYFYDIYKHALMPSGENYDKDIIDYQIKSNTELYETIEKKYQNEKYDSLSKEEKFSLVVEQFKKLKQ